MAAGATSRNSFATNVPALLTTRPLSLSRRIRRAQAVPWALASIFAGLDRDYDPPAPIRTLRRLTFTMIATGPLGLLQQDCGLVPVGFRRDGEHLEETLQPFAQALDVIEHLRLC